MIGKRQLNQEALTFAKVKSLIEKRKKEGELSYEQNLTLESCIKFSKVDDKKVAELLKELTGLEKIEENHAVALSYLMPKDADEVKIIFSKEHFIISDEEVNQILEILGKYRKEKKGKGG